MTQLNTLLGIIVSTLLLTNIVNAQTMATVKAEPINHKEIHAAVKLQLQDTMALSTTVVTANKVSAKDLPIATLLTRNSEQRGDKALNIAKTNYNAD